LEELEEDPPVLPDPEEELGGEEELEELEEVVGGARITG